MRRTNDRNLEVQVLFCGILGLLAYIHIYAVMDDRMTIDGVAQSTHQSVVLLQCQGVRVQFFFPSRA